MQHDKIIYLDYAAATPIDGSVFRAMEPYLTDRFYNPSSPYEPARQVRRDIEAARGSIARILGVRQTELTFTAGATESINLIFSSFQKNQAHIVVASTEHHAVLTIAKQGDYTEIQVDSKGRIELDQLKAAITDKTQLISLALANNEIGTIQPLKDVAQLISSIRQERMKTNNDTPLYLHTDASQAAGYIDVNVGRLGVDAMTLSAAKIYGPKQAGLLWARDEIKLQPLVFGGGQENGLRSGTENVAGIIGFKMALEKAESRRKSEVKRVEGLRNLLQSKITSTFPDAIISGDQKHRLAHILHVSFPGIDAERVLFSLEEKNILVATGAACAASKSTASHVLKAINMPESSMSGSLRFSFGKSTTESMIDFAFETLRDIIVKENERHAQE